MSFAYYDWIAHHAHMRGGRTALIDLASQRRFTYAEMDERVARLASVFRARGIKPGDRIAVLAANSSDMVESQFAAFRVGAIWVPLNVRLTVPELTYIVGDAEPSLFLHDADFASTARAVAETVGMTAMLAFGGAYEAALKGASPDRDHAAVSIEDVSTIMYTSGTTGRPKGATITHKMTFINAVNLGFPAIINPRAVFLCVLPLFHTGGLNCYTNPVLHAGGAAIIMRAFDPGESLRIIGDPAIGLTHFFGVPSIYQFMAQHPAFKNTDFSRLVMAGVGGAPMPVPLLKVFEDRGIALVQGFGMTETSPACLLLPAEDAARKAGSCGKLILHAEAKIVDEQGETVAPGAIGELWVRGPNITPGYWRREDANRTSFTDGWLHTGDAARMDAEGFYYIVDRTKDMYISGGENVYPAEVEDALYALPGVAEGAIIGVPDETWGETGLAIVVTRPGEQLTEAEVIAHCRERLARFKCPTGVVFVDALPRNATGKVHKPTLRERYKERTRLMAEPG